MGGNGSGKSTILNALNKILRFCFRGESYPHGLKISLDLSDHVKDISEFYINVINDIDNDVITDDVSFVSSGFIAYIYQVSRFDQNNPLRSNTPLYEFLSNIIRNIFTSPIDTLIVEFDSFISSNQASNSRFVKVNFGTNHELEKIIENGSIPQNPLNHHYDRPTRDEISPSLDIQYFIGFLIHKWLVTRSQEKMLNPNTPGYAFLDTEIDRFRE